MVPVLSLQIAMDISLDPFPGETDQNAASAAGKAGGEVERISRQSERL
jgi:hypothetical protein